MTRQPRPVQCVFAFFYPLLCCAAAIIEADYALRRITQVGDYESYSGEQFSLVPLYLGYHPPRNIPTLSLVGEVMIGDDGLSGRPLGRPYQQVRYFPLKNVIRWKPYGITDASCLHVLVKLRLGKGGVEYERNGVSSLFMLFAPLDGWRRVEVRERRTKVDWAHVIKKMVDEDYPDRDRIVLVMDNLNTHKLSSLYEAFEPAEARRIAERLEIHYTPKHGSWLNMAEIEIGVLARQCLDRRIANQDILRGEVNAWQNQRNRDVIRVDWRFTTEDARIKLKSLYPSIQKR